MSAKLNPGFRIVAGVLSLTVELMGLWPSDVAAASRKIYFYHADHLGSTHLVTDEQGQVVQLVQYKPFGEGYLETGTPAVSQKFTGQRADPSTGLYYYHARYYDPQLGRFIQPDPIVQAADDPQFLNRYSYVRNSPTNLVDPSGNFVFLAFLAAIAIGAIVGAATNVGFGAVTGQIHSFKDVGRFAAVGASIGAIGGAGGFAFGAAGLGLTGLAKGVADLGTFVAAGALGGGLDNALLGGSFGQGAQRGAVLAGAMFCVGLGFSALAHTELGEVVGGTARAGLRRLAESGAAQTIQRALGGAGEEAALSGAARRIPLGFSSLEQYQTVVRQFAKAAGADDALIGVRGSAATGVRFTGGTFGATSDIDFFIVSDQLYEQGARAGAVSRNGALSIGDTKRLFPQLHSVEKSLSASLGRDVTIRIFSQDGYNAIKSATDIYGQ